MKTEQVSPKLLIRVAIDDFHRESNSVAFHILLASSRLTGSEILDTYKKKKQDVKRVFDGRISLNEDESAKKEMIEDFVDKAAKYALAVVEDEFAVVYEKLLVDLVTRFERTMKTVALALAIYEKQGKNIDATCFISEDLYKLTRKDISKCWNEISLKKSEGKCRAEIFFDERIKTKLVKKMQDNFQNFNFECFFRYLDTLFSIRNSLVHNMGFQDTQVHLEEHLFPAACRLEINQVHIHNIVLNLSSFSRCFDLDSPEY